MRLMNEAKIPQVAQLDEFLNRRILDPCASPTETHEWWRRKITAKRRLAAVPPVDIAPVAAELLVEFRRAE